MVIGNWYCTLQKNKKKKENIANFLQNMILVQTYFCDIRNIISLLLHRVMTVSSRFQQIIFQFREDSYNFNLF